VKIPVFANGDIKARADAIACLEETKADGIMIGRGALGNPQIFSEILGSKPKYSKFEALLTMLKIMQKNYSEHYAICQMRAHLVHFLKNENNGAKAKIELLKIESTKKLKDAIIDFFSN
ncbi:MAG: tRNA-dihydrouridine synthase, partial [Clostridia bacterium]|nr:tRNA-dihydrouridine synthase [Clostridia bacterium]